MNGNETLDSLAEKFKKSRDIQIQNFLMNTKRNIQGQPPAQKIL